jgi:N-acetylmuramic acid 6-phosphate etherase
MNSSSQARSEEFLKISGQFKLGALVTESSHPVTAQLSEVAKQDIAAALKLLFDVDDDVIRTFREFVESGRAGEIKETILRSLKNGGRIFFTGCGSTGRLSILLDSIWRDFWQQQRIGKLFPVKDYETRTFSVMAGGDYALIKSVEGFEDFTAFGRKQINDLGVSNQDVVFAITEGGETSFVIGTAWAGVDAGAKVYFVYNNPDDVLCETVERSREVIADPRIEKINLTTGPMAIMGSTRMQATSIQLIVLLTVLEKVVRELLGLSTVEVARQSLNGLMELHASLKSPDVLAQLARLVELEESVYRDGHKNNYFAQQLGIDVLTDTTERSPTYCTPPYRKFDDANASESWSYLFVPSPETPAAWRQILKREPRCVEWNETEVGELVGADKFPRTMETIRKISRSELMRFKIGLDGLPRRRLTVGDSLVAVTSRMEKNLLLADAGFYHAGFAAAMKAGARTGLIHFGTDNSIRKIHASIAGWNADCVSVFVPLPETGLLLDGVKRTGVKLLLNALSTCTMVRLGRVMGNTMIWVVPSNLKLIDRATRYIRQITELSYERANQLLFEVIEYVEPRMKADQACPPVVGMAVLRAKYNLTNEEAEQRLAAIKQPVKKL